MRRERLERALAAPLRRRAVLGTIFWAMPKAVSRRALEKERLAVTWRSPAGATAVPTCVSS